MPMMGACIFPPLAFFLFVIFFNVGWCFANFTIFFKGLGNSWQTFWNRLASGKTFVLAPVTETVAFLGSVCCQGIRV